MLPAADHLAKYLDETDAGRVLGLYLTGSATRGGLRPKSDIDLVLVTERSLDQSERRGLVAALLGVSTRLGHPARPVEFTAVVQSDLQPWHYPPTCDFLFGEWLRAELSGGSIPQRHPRPDFAVMLTDLLPSYDLLRGRPPDELIVPVPPDDVRRAIVDSLPSLLSDLVGDERNVILTLARMLVTVSTADIVSKDEAARRIEAELPDSPRWVVNHAAAGYLGLVRDDWSARQQQVRDTANYLATRIRNRAL